MSRYSPLLAFSLALLSTFLPATATLTYCVPPQPLSASFCRSPPVVNDFDLGQYTGRWYQLYSSGTASSVSTNRCVTANYTLLNDGPVNVLNCQFPPGERRPQCQRAVAERRVGENPPHLQVQFAPFIPAAPYNVAALLGDAESGYEAAAVYSCAVSDAGLSEGFFIIARSPERPELVVEKLAEHLRCIGYTLTQPFVASYLGEECTYFDEGDGFVEVNMFEEDESEEEASTDEVTSTEDETSAQEETSTEEETPTEEEDAEEAI